MCAWLWKVVTLKRAINQVIINDQNAARRNIIGDSMFHQMLYLLLIYLFLLIPLGSLFWLYVSIINLNLMNILDTYSYQ